MAKLLVSVRNLDEALTALASGVDIIDLKEPSRGSLGRANRDAFIEVQAKLSGQVPLSGALGELRDFPESDSLDEIRGFQFVKFGHAGMAADPCWKVKWREVVEKFPVSTSPVAAAYGDYERCRAPSPEQILQVGSELGCSVFLVDTFSKDQGTLLDCIDQYRLHGLREAAHDTGMIFALAGSITIPNLTQILPLEPDVIAVRGAVCHANRTGTLSGNRIHQLRLAIRSYQFSAGS